MAPSTRSANETRREPSEGKMASAVHAISQSRAVDAGLGGGEMRKAGCARAARLMESEGPGILRMLWRLLGREADVMDAFQDCFCRLAALDGRRKLSNARAYAYRTATNIAIELIRSRQRLKAHWPRIVDREKNSSTHDAGDRFCSDDAKEALQQSIATLPPHLRNVIVLRDLNRLTYEEVGKTLGIDPATARVYRRHAVVKLAALLGEGSESCLS